MRLIDADAVMGTVFNDVVLIDGEVKGAGLILAETVDGAATVDAVPVVRCKGCKHSYEDISGLCCSYGFWVDCTVPEDFFCANGEQKGGGVEK